MVFPSSDVEKKFYEHAAPGGGSKDLPLLFYLNNRHFLLHVPDDPTGWLHMPDYIKNLLSKDAQDTPYVPGSGEFFLSPAAMLPDSFSYLTGHFSTFSISDNA